MIAERLDHVHLAVHRLADWVPLFHGLLGLGVIRGVQPGEEPPAGPGREMVVAEYQIGDGFVALLQPVAPEGQIGRFVERRGEGFYALSFDVGDLNRAADVLRERGIPFIDTRTTDHFDPERAGFLWISPGFTGGLAVQLTWQWSTEQGTNPNLLGLSSAVVAVPDVERALFAFEQLLDLKDGGRVRNDRFGYEGAVLPIGRSKDTLVLAKSVDDAKPLGAHATKKGAGIFSFTIGVQDLPKEVARLRAAGAAVETDGSESPRLAWLDPAVSRGIRIELEQAD